MMRKLFPTLLVSCIGFAGCDLTIHGLGEETASGGGSAGDAPSDSAGDAPSGDAGDGGPCVAGPDGSCDDPGQLPLPCEVGEQTPAPDGCNTCVCGADGWACTELGCMGEGGGGPDDVCEEGSVKSSDDGCNTCTCLEGAWACSQMPCEDTDGDVDVDSSLPLESCGPETPFDGLFVNDASIIGDTLRVAVTTSGGCAEHVFGGCWDETFLETFPVQAQLQLSHDANGDICEALLSEEIFISLESMRESYQTEHGTIIIRIPNYEGGSVVYEF